MGAVMASRGPRLGGAVAMALVAVASVGYAEADDPPPATLAVAVVPVRGVGEAERRLLEEAIAGAAGRGGAWKLVGRPSAGDRAAAEAAVRDRSDKALARSDKSLDEAENRIKNLEEGALDLLDWAADEYSKYLPDLAARDGSTRRLVQVYAAQAIQHYLDGHQDDASQALRHCFVLEPDLDYDPKVFPPQLEQFVMQERLLFDELGSGKLEVRGVAGVQVWVNGVDRGVTPVKLAGVRAGPNFVTLAVPGLDPVTVSAAVDGGHVTVVEAGTALAKSKEVGGVAAAAAGAGGEVASSGLRAAAADLGAEAVLVVIPAPGAGKDAGSLELRALVYDLRSGARVGGGEARPERSQAAAAAGELAGSALAAAHWKARLERGGGGVWVGLRSGWRRARTSKYFWPAVGVTAGVVVIGVWAASSGLSTGEQVSILPVIRF